MAESDATLARSAELDRRLVAAVKGIKLLASVSYYATHPQSAYGRGLISADSIGEALRLTRKRFPAAQHLYFTGCAANITSRRRPV